MSALHMAKALDLIGRDKPPTACCPSDGEPVIATFAFSGAEFCCVVCGRLLGFLDPVAKEDTPELAARHAELQAVFDDEVRPLLAPSNSGAALKWLRERGRADA